jgi:hypothetical protein
MLKMLIFDEKWKRVMSLVSINLDKNLTKLNKF